jgi:quercetin dioxygenase-like cupin family protein
MTICRAVILLAICLLFPVSAFALDQSGDVKATTILKTTDSWDGKPIVYPDGKAEITGLLVEIAPGGKTGWHLHPVPSFGLVLEGTLEVTLQNGSVKRLQAGDAIAEVVNTPHNGHNVGDITVKLVVFYAGTLGQAFSIKEP